MTDFDYYIRKGEPSLREKAEAWAVAIGLQDVDGPKTSDYLRETTRRHIEGGSGVCLFAQCVDGRAELIEKAIRTC